MQQGVRAAGDAGYILFTDADIGYAPGVVAALVRAAEDDDRGLVSQMALLRADTFWERLLVPAFVYFFAQLYPFRRVNRPGARTAAAAGGCMLVRRERAGGGGRAGAHPRRPHRRRGARPAAEGPARAGALLARADHRTSPAGARTRAWPGLWDMVARSAYTQLRYSPAALAGTLAGLVWLYALPPAAALGGLGWLAAGGGPAAGWLAATGLAGWAIMTVSYAPDPAAVPAVAVAGPGAAADRPAVRGDDRRFRAPLSPGPGRAVERAHDPGYHWPGRPRLRAMILVTAARKTAWFSVPEWSAARRPSIAAVPSAPLPCRDTASRPAGVTGRVLRASPRACRRGRPRAAGARSAPAPRRRPR